MTNIGDYAELDRSRKSFYFKGLKENTGFFTCRWLRQAGAFLLSVKRLWYPKEFSVSLSLGDISKYSGAQERANPRLKCHDNSDVAPFKCRRGGIENIRERNAKCFLDIEITRRLPHFGISNPSRAPIQTITLESHLGVNAKFAETQKRSHVAQWEHPCIFDFERGGQWV